MIPEISRPNRLSTVVCAIGLVVSTTLPAIATPSSVPTSRSTPGSTLVAQRLGFTVDGVRPSRSRVGGISRGGSCSLDGRPVVLTPLLPKSNPQVVARGQVEVEYTTVDRPTFFVHVPRNQAHYGEFSLVDEDQNILAQTTFNLPTEPGVVGISVPSDVPALEVGGAYYWSVSLVCDSLDRSADLYVDGWVERISLNAALSQQIQQSQPRNRPSLYARAGIWQDTLSTLADLRLANPQDRTLLADWESLLGSVDLMAIAREPISKIELPPSSPDATTSIPAPTPSTATPGASTTPAPTPATVGTPGASRTNAPTPRR